MAKNPAKSMQRILQMQNLAELLPRFCRRGNKFDKLCRYLSLNLKDTCKDKSIPTAGNINPGQSTNLIRWVLLI